jgi:hypothetical protein
MSAMVGRVAVLAWALVAASSCGYALAGRGNALPDTIKVIGVPQFVNHSTQPEIDRILTEAVREEFQSKGRYTVQPDNINVDGLLTVTVTNVMLQPTGFTQDPVPLPSSYAIVLTASVEFKNLRDNGNVLWSNPSFIVTDEYSVAGAALDVTALFSQNANARERLARKFARDVVTSIFEAF